MQISDELLEERMFYHGTHQAEDAAAILHEGFKEGYGLLGTGVYITKNWRWALFFGKYLLKVEVQKGTRILDLAQRVNKKGIKHLVREFGKDILRSNPLKIIPKNKQLTGEELVELVLYTYHKAYAGKYDGKMEIKEKIYRLRHFLERSLRAQLINYQYDGYGNPEDDMGYVIFSPDRVKPVHLELVVPDELYCASKWKEGADGTKFILEDKYEKYKTLDALKQKIKSIGYTLRNVPNNSL